MSEVKISVVIPLHRGQPIHTILSFMSWHVREYACSAYGFCSEAEAGRTK